MRLRRLMQIVLAAAVVLLVSGIWLDRSYGRAFWEIGGARVGVLVALAALFGVSALVVVWRQERGRGGLIDVIVAAAVLGVAAVSTLVLPGVEVSTAAVGLALVSAVALLFLLYWQLLPRLTLAAMLAVVCLAAGIHGAYAAGYLPRPVQPSVSTLTVPSSLYRLDVRRYSNPIPRPLQSGGGVARLDDDYLLAAGDGRIYRFAENADRSALTVRPLALRVPTNPEDFRSAAAPYDLRLEWFRVADVHVMPDGDRLRLFATYHYWNDADACYTVRLGVTEFARAELDQLGADHAWQVLFESVPCVKLVLDDGTGFFGGLQIGGRMASIGTNTLLFTVGDHEFDGVTAPISYPQDSASSYGKIFSLDLATNAVAMMTMGHRNPQGLMVADDGAIWSTEHGPRGGDELNLIRAGENYGWPLVTFGVDYGSNAWPFNARQGTHDGYAAPVYAWIPSIGVSGLTSVSGPSFDLWKGDLIVGSLDARRLWRLRLMDGHVVVSEDIDLGLQTRDIIEGHDSQLVIWNERHPGPEISFIEPARSESDRMAGFAQCLGCHSMGSGTDHGLGPDLAGIVGRPVAAARGFTYSRALTSLGGTWSVERLDAFLTDPAAFAPGTSMRMPGISDAAQRNSIIQQLEADR